MSEPSKAKTPYELLGAKLRRLRVMRQESIADVSGAVEIDIDALTSIENGSQRPGEDILLLLISHFGVKEDAALKLWQLAGYSQQNLPPTTVPINDELQSLPTVVVVPLDARIAYTDIVHVMVNDFGVVMNFMQGSGTSTQPLVVARLGMSKEHAYSVLEVLQKTLQQNEPKRLPDSHKKNDQQQKET
ncbi:MAG: hypothetical protein NVSMB46_02440 [Candidatus Saccharimonadales bacterium]